MAKPLFLPEVDPHAFFEKEASIGKMPDDEKNWPAHILSMLHEQLPFLSNFSVNILIQRMEPEAGFAFGYAMVLSKSDPRVSTPSKNVENGIRIPIIVADRQLQPFHTFELNGQVFPLTPDRVEAVLMNPAMFDGPSSRPKSQKSLVDQLYPPYQQRQGFGLTNTGTNTGGISKVSSAPKVAVAPADLMAAQVAPKDLRNIAKLKETERADKADAQLSMKERLGRAARSSIIPIAATAGLTALSKGRAASVANKAKGAKALQGMDAAKNVAGEAWKGLGGGAAIGSGVAGINTTYQEMARRRRDKQRQAMGLEATAPQQPMPPTEKMSAAPSLLRSTGIGALSGALAGGVGGAYGSDTPVEDALRGAALGGSVGGALGAGSNLLHTRKFRQELGKRQADLSDLKDRVGALKDIDRVNRDRVRMYRDKGRLSDLRQRHANDPMRGVYKPDELDEMSRLKGSLDDYTEGAKKALEGMGFVPSNRSYGAIDSLIDEARIEKATKERAAAALAKEIEGMTAPEPGLALRYGMPALAAVSGAGLGRATASPNMNKESSAVKEALARLDFSPNRRIPSSMVMGNNSKVKVAPGVTPMSIHFFPVMGTKFVVGVDRKLAKKLSKMKDQNEIRRALVGPMKSELRAARGGRPSPGMFMLFVKTKNGYAYQPPKAVPGMSA